jgi:hypothetical protein
MTQTMYAHVNKWTTTTKRMLIHTHILTSYPSPFLGKFLTCGTPLGSSWEWIKLCFCPVGQDLTEGWFFRNGGLTESGLNNQVSWSTSLWSLSPVKTAQRVGTPGWRRTWCTPAAGRWLKGSKHLDTLY